MSEINIYSIEEPESDYQQKVLLSHLLHRGERQISIVFPILIRAVRQIDGAAWSDSNKCWYVQNKPDNLKRIFAVFRGLAWVYVKQAFFHAKFYYLIEILFTFAKFFVSLLYIKHINAVCKAKMSNYKLIT